MFRLEIDSSSAQVRSALIDLSSANADYWDFRETPKEAFDGTLYQYPAMMVPAMQRAIIETILEKNPNIACLCDPFIGSGTILAQAMLSGKSFVGQDINPLALLLSKARANCLNASELTSAVAAVCKASDVDRSREYAVQFYNQSKWFTKGANIGLSRLRRAILKESKWESRLFLWTCLAETIRQKSNSRTSTFKLHIRPESERNATTADVTTAFAAIAQRNLKIVQEFTTLLAEKGFLTAQHKFIGTIAIHYGDSSVAIPKNHISKNGTHELVVTSPPYGDNKTTVPYGQAAWLPLQWIHMADIDPAVSIDVLVSTAAIDSASLGGRRRRELLAVSKELKEIGPHTGSMVDRLAAVSEDGLSRYVSFVADLRSAMKSIADQCVRGTFLVWTVGNRHISGIECPLADILIELFAELNISLVVEVKRKIPSKRIPSKNNMSKTIADEFVIVFRHT